MALLSVKEAAKRLAVSPTRVRAMLADGLLIGEKDSADWGVSEESIEIRRALHGQLSPGARLKVLLRDGGKCQNEGHEGETNLESVHVHHVMPRAKGGTNEISNLVTLCCDCHRILHGLNAGASKARVAIAYTVLPGTKAALKRLSSKERTAGEILDLAVGYWERTLGAPETSRVVELEPVELPVTSYWGTSYLLELQDEYGVDEKSAMDMVFDFYKSMGKVCPACAGRLGGFGEAEEAVATSSVAPSTLPAPGDVRCSCAHCGEVYMASRLGNLCFGCASGGHAGDVRDCSVCGEARGL